MIDQLIQANYAFAIWKMPDKAKFNFIISLQKPAQVETSITRMNKGFIINQFTDNHPIRPFYIGSDIIIKEGETFIDPVVKGSDINQFNKQIQTGQNKVSQIKTDKNLTHTSNADEYESIVALAIDTIKKGVFEKVVVSRYEDKKLPDHFSIWDFFIKVMTSYPNAFCNMAFIPGKGLWIGASPELLVSDDENRFKTVALAGTKKLRERQALEEVAWTHKEIEEQALVSRYIVNCFKKIRLREFHEHGPKTIHTGNLAHLKTKFEVYYNELSSDGLSNQMLELLHPTSAVCGMPVEKAKSFISKVEGYKREFYSGFLGPVNYNGSIDLFVNLRCIKIEGVTARFYAGAGITEDSVPEKEFEETESKMNILKSLF